MVPLESAPDNGLPTNCCRQSANCTKISWLWPAGHRSVRPRSRSRVGKKQPSIQMLGRAARPLGGSQPALA